MFVIGRAGGGGVVEVVEGEMEMERDTASHLWLQTRINLHTKAQWLRTPRLHSSDRQSAGSGAGVVFSAL